MLKKEITQYSTKQLEVLLYNSTISELENEVLYNQCINTIEKGDLLSREELYWLLIMNQRDSFYELPSISVKAINKQLDKVENDITK